MTKEIIVPSNVHRVYVHAVKAGKTIYISGQVGMGEDGKIVAGGIEAQLRQTLENLKRIVEAAGGSLKDVVKLNGYATSMDFFPVWRKLYRSYFGDYYPASTMVQVAALAMPELLIEIEAVVVLD